MKPSFSATRVALATVCLLTLHACGPKDGTSSAVHPPLSGQHPANPDPNNPNDPTATDPNAPRPPVPRPSSAPPFISSLFGNHMVLQHTGANVFGWTTPGTPVTVTLPELNISVTAAGDPNTGKWVAKLGALTVGGPYTVQITGPQDVTFQDVMAGEVWLSSGQSNSVVSLGDIAANTYATYDPSWNTMATAEMANANDTNVRMFFQQWAQSTVYEYDVKGGIWQACSPDVAKSFGAAPYLFARSLQNNLKMPVGILEASLGGTAIREWVSDVGLASVGTLPAFTGTNASDLFNGMIAPYEDYKLAGVTWYQGEADCTSPDTLLYGKMQTALFSSWRYTINDSKLPFVVVSLANYGPPQSSPHENDGYAASDIREQQRRAVMGDPHAALAVAVDIGDANTIHPPNKWDVGARMSLAAMGLVYQSATESSGPLLQSSSTSGSQAVLTFTHTTGGMMAATKSGVNPAQAATGSALSSFAVQDSTGAWFAGTAVISGNTLTVTAPGVAAPKAVCYGWAANPSANLYNGSGLPASPFCTQYP